MTDEEKEEITQHRIDVACLSVFCAIISTLIVFAGFDDVLFEQGSSPTPGITVLAIAITGIMTIVYMPITHYILKWSRRKD